MEVSIRESLFYAIDYGPLAGPDDDGQVRTQYPCRSRPDASGTVWSSRARSREEILMSGLSERDMRILAFVRRGWRSPAVKEQAIAELLQMPATRYYQLLNQLIDRPEALAFDSMLVKRLRAQRARRRRIRSPKPGGTEGQTK